MTEVKDFFYPGTERTAGGIRSSDAQKQSLSARSTAEARAVLPFSEALRLQSLPLVIEAESGYSILHIAVAKGYEEQARVAVRFQAGCEVSVVPVSREYLEEEIFKAYKGDAKVLQCLPAAGREPLQEKVPDDSLLIAYDKGQGDAVKGLAALIDYAVAHGISDIHITPLAQGVRIRARKTGALMEREELIGDAQFHKEITNRLKVLIRAPVTTVCKPLDGSFPAGTASKKVRIRVSIMPSIHGDNIVLRILENTPIHSLHSLGYSSDLVMQLEKICKKNAGLFLICGSTGSGKTTALYALGQYVADLNKLVHTLEDPIEQALDSLVQTEIDPARGITYANCFPALLRQDPDCIVLGELRDRESAAAIVQAALTGHNTLASVHGGSIQSVFERFNQFQVKPDEFIAALSGILYQLLVPVLCESCAVMDLVATRRLKIKACKPVGCSRCDYTGYRGRVPVVEAFFPELDWRVSGRKFTPGIAYKSGWYCQIQNGLEQLLKASKIDIATYEAYLNE